MAEHLLCVGQQFERQILLGFEVVVRTQAVARYAGDDAASLDERGEKVSELLRFCRATRSAVFGIEIQNDDLSFLVRESERFAAGSGQLEITDDAVDH